MNLGDTVHDGDVVMGAYLDGGEGVSAGHSVTLVDRKRFAGDSPCHLAGRSR